MTIEQIASTDLIYKSTEVYQYTTSERYDKPILKGLTKEDNTTY